MAYTTQLELFAKNVLTDPLAYIELPPNAGVPVKMCKGSTMGCWHLLLDINEYTPEWWFSQKQLTSPALRVHRMAMCGCLIDGTGFSWRAEKPPYECKNIQRVQDGYIRAVQCSKCITKLHKFVFATLGQYNMEAIKEAAAVLADMLEEDRRMVESYWLRVYLSLHGIS